MGENSEIRCHQGQHDGIYHRSGYWQKEPTDQEIAELLKYPKKIEDIREFLGSISGFMAQVKQPVAELFNKETSVTGNYWGRRYGNRHLEHWSEVIGGSFYVDLNHARAGAATSLETSHCSAIQDRLLADEARRCWIEENTEKSLEQIYEDHVHGSSDLPPEVLQKLFRDAWLAPITDSGPRYSEDLERIQAVSAETSIPQLPEELPHIEADDQSTAGAPSSGTSAATLDAMRENDAKESDVQMGDAAGDAHSEMEEGRASEATVGGPVCAVRPRTKSLLKHYRSRLKRRKSDWCFIDTTRTAYIQTVQTLAAQIVASREPGDLTSPADGVAIEGGTSNSGIALPIPDTPEVDWRTTAADMYRDFRGFLAHTLSVIASGFSSSSTTSPDGPTSSASKGKSAAPVSSSPPPSIQCSDSS